MSAEHWAGRTAAQMVAPLAANLVALLADSTAEKKAGLWVMKMAAQEAAWMADPKED